MPTFTLISILTLGALAHASADNYRFDAGVDICRALTTQKSKSYVAQLQLPHGAQLIATWGTSRCTFGDTRGKEGSNDLMEPTHALICDSAFVIEDGRKLKCVHKGVESVASLQDLTQWSAHSDVCYAINKQVMMMNGEEIKITPGRNNKPCEVETSLGAEKCRWVDFTNQRITCHTWQSQFDIPFRSNLLEKARKLRERAVVQCLTTRKFLLSPDLESTYVFEKVRENLGFSRVTKVFRYDRRLPPEELAEATPAEARSYDSGGRQVVPKGRNPDGHGLKFDYPDFKLVDSCCGDATCAELLKNPVASSPANESTGADADR